MKKKGTLEGSMTVFYALIFSSMLAFLLVLLSFGRRMIMQTGVRKDMDLSAFGVLAEYQKEWADDYGLYMVPEEKLSGSFEYYMKKNAQHLTGDYTYQDILVVPEESLLEAGVLEEQIRSFMQERGYLSLLDDLLEILMEARDGAVDAEVTLEATGGVEGTAVLSEIQEEYALLITDMEGIRNDGGREYYFINGLLKEEPSLDELKLILAKMLLEAENHEAETAGTVDPEEEIMFEGTSSHELGDLERGLSWIMECRVLCLDAEEKMRHLAELRAQLEEKEEEMSGVLEMIPYEVDEMQDDADIMKDNVEICDKAEEALRSLIHMFSESFVSSESINEQIRLFRNIEDYDASIELPYDYKAQAKPLRLSDLLKKLQGYPDNLSILAEDKDLELDLEDVFGEEEEWKGSLSQLTFGEGFENAYLEGEYCIEMLRNFRETIAESEGVKTENIHGKEKKGRFFRNEAEYLIVGKNNEYQNVKGTRERILLLRTVLNMAFLLTNPEKRSEIDALAASTGGILLPGVGDVVAFGAILTAWSLAESIGDYRTLTEGNQVPLIKTEDSWKTDLTSLVESVGEDITGDIVGDIVGDETETDRGLDYGDYVKILLYMLPRELRLQRIQELLILNHDHYPLEQAVTKFRVYGTASGIGILDFEADYGFYE